MAAGAKLVALYEASDDDDDAKAFQRAKDVLESGDYCCCCFTLRHANDSAKS